MENAGMESFVNCPNCGEQVPVILKPYQDMISGLMKVFEGTIGVGKTEHFGGENKCKCGITVVATLHVTAKPMEANNVKN